MLPVPQVSDLGHIELIAMTSLPSMAETLRKELLASLDKFFPEHPDSKCATTYATGPPHRGKPLRHITRALDVGGKHRPERGHRPLHRQGREALPCT